MAVTCRPEQLQGQERSQGGAGWDHLRSGDPDLEDAIEEDADNIGRKRKRPPNWVWNEAGSVGLPASAASAVVGRGPGGRSSSPGVASERILLLEVPATATWLRAWPWWARSRLIS